MRTQDIDTALAAANPVDRAALAALDLGDTGRGLLAAILAEPAEGQNAETIASPGRDQGRYPRRILFVIGGGAVAIVAAILVVLGANGGPAGRPTPAYGAELVRFAQSTPLLLLEGPGWRVQNVDEYSNGEGQLEFVTGKPIPSESIRITGSEETGQRESGMFPAAVRQRKVELSWLDGSLRSVLKGWKWRPERTELLPHGRLKMSHWVAVGRWTTVPVLGTTAYVNTRAGVFVNQRGPGNRQMKAIWREDGHVLEMNAAVPDLAAFKERLGWLHKVDSQTWLDAMPAKVIKAADHEAAVREMLKGIPLPSDFKPSLVPDAGLTTNRDQVAGAVTNTVSCLWFLQWGEARRTGDRAKKLEAERAMATYKSWPILRQMAKEGGYPETIVKLVASMPSGVWKYGPHRYRLLAKAEGLGCAREGLPLLPREQKLQRERGVPPPP
jgi:hypothetical protein